MWSKELKWKPHRLSERITNPMQIISEIEKSVIYNNDIQVPQGWQDISNDES